MALSETFGREEAPCEVPDIPGYEVWNTERSGNDKQGGGLALIYRNTLNVHRHEPTVPDNFDYVKKERQWLLIISGSLRCAFLHCYLACQTTRNDTYIQWNEDMFSLLSDEAMHLKQQGFMILALGNKVIVMMESSVRSH